MKTKGVAKKPVSNKKSTATKKPGIIPGNKTAGRTRAGSRKTQTESGAQESRKGLVSRVQDIIGENEETIHLVLEIAAMTLERTEMSRKKKRISKAVLNLLSEILDTDYEEISGHKSVKA